MRTEATRGKLAIHIALVHVNASRIQVPTTIRVSWSILTEQTFTYYLLSVQESGEFAEGLSARTLPLRLTAVSTRRPAEGSDSNSTFCAFCSICPSLPPSAPLFLRCLLTCPHNHPQSTSHHDAVSHSDLPTQPQHSRASLPAPNTGAYIPQPQPDSTATMAVVMSFTLLINGVLCCSCSETNLSQAYFGCAFCSSLSLFFPTEGFRCNAPKQTWYKVYKGTCRLYSSIPFHCMLAQPLPLVGLNRKWTLLVLLLYFLQNFCTFCTRSSSEKASTSQTTKRHGAL